jgi:hypothetical protein
VEFQKLRAVRPAELEDHYDEGGGAGESVLRPIGDGDGAWAGRPGKTRAKKACWEWKTKMCEGKRTP